MRIFLLIFLLITTHLKVWCQNQVSINPQRLEELFLKQNLELVAEKLNVSMADAAIAQAKLWDNPSIKLDGLNFWSSESRRDGETIDPIWGSLGRNTQFSLELSQMISVSGKRNKQVKMEMVSREMALVKFEQVLLELKLELRRAIAEIIYLQQYSKALTLQRSYLSEMVEAYKKQYANGNISGSELMRLQSALLETDNEINNVNMEINASQKNIKNLVAAPNDVYFVVTPQYLPLPDPSQLSLSSLTDTATQYRTDINLQKLQTEYHKKSVTYQKSLRIPDLDLSVGYDRRGGVWPDFVGIGIGVEIPIFNRNQGAIKTAYASQKQSQYIAEQKLTVAENEIAEALANYAQTYELYLTTTHNEILEGLDNMIQTYTENLIKRNISMLEYMDFMDTYKNAKQTIYATQRDAHMKLEELKFAAGTDNLNSCLIK